jgi:hypothetical protein
MVILKKYKLEKDMCDELTRRSREAGWIVYPEQGGWDLLLVRNHIQVGVQAKLRPTIKLFSQAIVSEEYPGPHYRAVAVGNMSFKERKSVARVARTCGLVLIDMSCHPDYWLSAARRGDFYFRKVSWRYYRHFPNKLIWTPPFVPKLAAGVPHPRTVSPWMVAAVKLELFYKDKGYVTIADARRIVKEEVPDCKNSYPRSLLQTYFKCTREKAPEIKRGKKWKLRSRPSKKYPYVLVELIERYKK